MAEVIDLPKHNYRLKGDLSLDKRVICWQFVIFTIYPAVNDSHLYYLR